MKMERRHLSWTGAFGHTTASPSSLGAYFHHPRSIGVKPSDGNREPDQRNCHSGKELTNFASARAYFRLFPEPHPPQEPRCRGEGLPASGHCSTCAGHLHSQLEFSAMRRRGPGLRKERNCPMHACEYTSEKTRLRQEGVVGCNNGARKKGGVNASRHEIRRDGWNRGY